MCDLVKYHFFFSLFYCRNAVVAHTRDTHFRGAHGGEKERDGING